MEAIKITDNTLPKYSEKEETFNMISHLFGVLIGLLTIMIVIFN